jgi:hypothetical protein
MGEERRRYMKRLRRLWRRVVYCSRGQHRETIDGAYGSMLRTRCVDCGSMHFIGWVFRFATNKLHSHFPWDRPDDA